jgi:hypothetical protein
MGIWLEVRKKTTKKPRPVSGPTFEPEYEGEVLPLISDVLYSYSQHSLQIFSIR